ncbi:MAG: hypothetical protein ABIF92_02850 [archaeon]
MSKATPEERVRILEIILSKSKDIRPLFSKENFRGMDYIIDTVKYAFKKAGGKIGKGILATGLAELITDTGILEVLEGKTTKEEEVVVKLFKELRINPDHVRIKKLGDVFNSAKEFVKNPASVALFCYYFSVVKKMRPSNDHPRIRHLKVIAERGETKDRESRLRRTIYGETEGILREHLPFEDFYPKEWSRRALGLFDEVTEEFKKELERYRKEVREKREKREKKKKKEKRKEKDVQEEPEEDLAPAIPSKRKVTLQEVQDRFEDIKSAIEKGMYVELYDECSKIEERLEKENAEDKIEELQERVKILRERAGDLKKVRMEFGDELRHMEMLGKKICGFTVFGKECQLSARYCREIRNILKKIQQRDREFMNNRTTVELRKVFIPETKKLNEKLQEIIKVCDLLKKFENRAKKHSRYYIDLLKLYNETRIQNHTQDLFEQGDYRRIPHFFVALDIVAKLMMEGQKKEKLKEIAGELHNGDLEGFKKALEKEFPEEVSGRASYFKTNNEFFE